MDLAAAQIRFHGVDTKNEEARTLPIYGDMREWLLLAKETRDRKFPDCPWVFYSENGQRLYWFYKVWKLACKRARVPNLLFHDLRRSAVRNMERAGVPRKVAMAISGHKTASIYRRYDIVVHRDLADAATRMEQFFSTAQATLQDRKEPMGTLLGTPAGVHPQDDQEARPKYTPKVLK